MSLTWGTLYFIFPKTHIRKYSMSKGKPFYPLLGQSFYPVEHMQNSITVAPFLRKNSLQPSLQNRIPERLLLPHKFATAYHAWYL